jgi:hypothetical protein
LTVAGGVNHHHLLHSYYNYYKKMKSLNYDYESVQNHVKNSNQNRNLKNMTRLKMNKRMSWL